jgi:hypothetical protein
MIERLTPKTETETPNTETKKPSTRAKANKRHFTEELVQRLQLSNKEELYVIYRDEKQDGLSSLPERTRAPSGENATEGIDPPGDVRPYLVPDFALRDTRTTLM